ncbi:Alpha/Beta hydrolase protein [Stachybotrys elegans]|uniref:Alpha/Beta hydrolase protein n=1 Tax=Stachybotrys elegans TaxID=80388 RepID=A0A8K0WQC4_9HYPO|nr:Alpha/Beta hydrolase protein [Stachybotrys elegans]
MRFLRGAVRAAARLDAATPSASLPDALPPSSQNSTAFSAAVAELAESLDFVFDRLDSDDEPGDLLHLHLQRLGQEASKYTNSRVTARVGHEWSCSDNDLQLFLAACQCSSLAYKPDAEPDASLEHIMHSAPSVAGTKKAASLWKLDSQNTLIIAVRGTKGAADHMVNLNSELRDASSLLKFSGYRDPILAHSGFLACAKSIRASLIREIIRQMNRDPGLSQVIFTGHSAGGAVSSLVFLSLLCDLPTELSAIRLSLVTFGSAPVISTDVTDLVRRSSNVDHFTAFINEYDMVTRADKPYLRSIIDLYRSKYGLPPLNQPHGQSQVQKDGHWLLPSPNLQPVGDIVITQMVLNLSPATEEELPATPKSPWVLKATKIPHAEFGSLLFCDVAVHQRRVYLQRMEILAGKTTVDMTPPRFLDTAGTWNTIIDNQL